MSSPESSLAARTDQTALCRRCVARFGGAVCPACDSEPAFDLSRVEHRWQANAWLAETNPEAMPFAGPDSTHSIALPASVLTTGAMLGIGVVTGHWLAWAVTAASGAVVIARAVAWGHERLWSGKHVAPSRSGKVLVGVIAPRPPPAGADRVRRRGIAECDAPLHAPLSGEPCIAYRLVGRVGECVVDDAAAVPFTIVGRDGPRVSVLASASIVELPVHATHATPAALERVQVFVSERGVNASSAPIALAEGILRPGEEVVVEGALESVTTGQAYRGAATTEYLVGRRDAPVSIKKA